MLGRVCALCLAALVLLAFGTSDAPAQATKSQQAKRIGLVIGNDKYTEIRELRRAVNDGRAVAAGLRELGFEIQEGSNLNQRQMSLAILSASARVERGDTVFLFFAGHGVEIAGENFLLPTDVPAAEVGQEEWVKDSAFSANRVIDRFVARGASLVIAVFDACRNNPFESPGRRALNVGRGLAPMERVEGVFILFSAGAKQLALDFLQPNDPDPNSVFTRRFLERLKQPGLSLVDLAKTIQQEVRDLAATVRHPQSPAYYDGVVGHVYLAGRPTTSRSETAPANVPSPAALDRAIELSYWESVRNSNSVAMVQSYLDRYPEGAFAVLARALIADLQRRQASLPAPSAPPPPALPPSQPQPAPLAIPTGGILRIGVAGPMTGPNAAFGAQLRNGVEQAVADLNAAGGILGHRIVLSVGDDVSDPRQGVSVANKFVADGIKFVVGHFNSGVTMPASEVYQESNILAITPSATNPRLTERGMWNIFRTSGRDDQQAAIAADWVLANMRGKKIAIVHDKTTYGQGALADGFKKQLNRGGMREVLYEGINLGEKDFSLLVAKIKASGVDLVYWGGLHTEGGLIVRQMRDQGVRAVMMSGDGITTDEFATVGGPGVEGTLMTFAADPRARREAKAVIERFRAKKFEPEAYTLYAYAAVQVLKQAAEAAKSVDPKVVAARMKTMKFNTVLGEFSYDSKGDPVRPDYIVYIWKKDAAGKITYVPL